MLYESDKPLCEVVHPREGQMGEGASSVFNWFFVHSLLLLCAGFKNGIRCSMAV